MAIERTLVLIKPDGVERGLTGEIISRFERAGIRLIEMRLLTPSADLAAAHYPSDIGWLSSVGQKTLDDYAARGASALDALGTENAEEIGRSIKGRLTTYLSSGQVVALVLEGNRVVESVRKMVGATIPTMAVPGTIRGDYSLDSPDIAEAEGRPVRNLIHASGAVDEAQTEIALWFGA